MAGTAPRVLAVFSRVGDETCEAGGTLAALTAAGAEVTVAIVTRGEAQAVMPEYEYLAHDVQALGALRESELVEALAALGVRDHRFVGGARARATGSPVHVYRETDAVDLDELAADIAAVIDDVQPDVVVTHEPLHDAVVGAIQREESWQPRALFLAVRPRAVERARERDLRVRGLGVAPEPRGAVIDDRLVDVNSDVRGQLDLKRRALESFGSALRLVDGVAIDALGHAQLVAGFEYFREIGGGVYRTTSTPAPDFFRGWDDLGSTFARRHSRLGSALVTALAVIGGAATGALFSLIHLAVWRSGDVEIAVGLILALVGVTLVTLTFRAFAESRWTPVLFGLGVIAAITILGIKGPGGDVLVPAEVVHVSDGAPYAAANVSSYIWTIGACVGVAVIVGWPARGDNRKTRATPNRGEK